MTASRSVRLSAAAAVLSVAAVSLGTGSAGAGESTGHVSGEVTCNSTTGVQTIEWNFASNGRAGSIDSANMSGATTGAVTMTPSSVTTQDDESNGTAMVNGVTGVVNLIIVFTPNNLPTETD